MDAVTDENRSLPPKALLAPQRTGTWAMRSDQSGNVTGEEHAMHDSTSEICSASKIFVHVQGIRIAADAGKAVHILGRNRLFKVSFITWLDLVEIGEHLGRALY